jgi:caffeoyl-CoA O-methyltransferase
LDINAETAKIAQSFWAKSPHGSKIKLHLAPALETMKELKGPFDLMLIDADKENYLSYLKRGLELVSDKGLIVLDNCLWSGKVADSKQSDPETEALRQTADFVRARADLSSVLIPLRDGLLLVQRKS